MNSQHIILLVTSRPAQLKEFSSALCREEKMTVMPVESAKEAIIAAREVKPVLAVVDDQVRGVSGLDIVRRLIEENAFIQTAAISELSEHEFHNRSEGLGILSQLPLLPEKGDALRLLELLGQVISVPA